jgi:hypothetical protein
VLVLVLGSVGYLVLVFGVGVGGIWMDGRIEYCSVDLLGI